MSARTTGSISNAIVASAAVPNTVRVARDHPEAIRARAEVGVNGLARRDRFAPAMIESVQHVSVSDAIGSRKAHPRITEGEPLAGRRNANRIPQVDRTAIR